MNPSFQVEVNGCREVRVGLAGRSIIDSAVAHWHIMPIHLSEEIGMPTRNVVLTNYQASFVERLVSTGRYQNASEVLREGLRMVEQREAEDACFCQFKIDQARQLNFDQGLKPVF